MKKQFNKKLVTTKKDVVDFENSTKCWIHDNVYVDGDVKARDYCHIIGQYRGSTHRHSNINAKLNHEIRAFHNLKSMIHILLCKN